MANEDDLGYEADALCDLIVKDPKRLADEAARDLQTVLASAGVSDDVLRNVVQKVQQRGRGGRTPAGDPRLDPNVDPKKAKRILANRLSAAKSKMRQRVLSESLEILKAKENSRNASVERSDGPPQPHTQRDTSTTDELRQVRRTCMELQAKTRELESRVRVLEAQIAIAASPSLNHPLTGASGLRIVGAPPSFSSDSQSILSALAAAGAGTAGSAAAAGPGSSSGALAAGAVGSSGLPPARSPLLTSAGLNTHGPLSLLNLNSSAAAAMQSSLSFPLMDASGRLDTTAGTAGSSWVLDSAALSHLASLGLPPMTFLPPGMSLGVGLGGSHAVLQTVGSGPSDSQASKDGGRGRK